MKKDEDDLQRQKPSPKRRKKGKKANIPIEKKKPSLL